jgi:hypothetical protein
MSILAIDTAASRTSVVVIEKGEVVFHEFRDGAMSHGPALPELVKAAIKNQEITEVLVGMGPGPTSWNYFCPNFCLGTRDPGAWFLFTRCDSSSG